jgi:hypothetical protein
MKNAVGDVGPVERSFGWLAGVGVVVKPSTWKEPAAGESAAGFLSAGNRKIAGFTKIVGADRVGTANLSPEIDVIG